MLNQISYDPVTGLVTRIEDGFVAGSKPRKSGYYIAIRLWGKKYWVHRLAYEAHFGPIPPGMVVDHINGNKRDNRAINLRLASVAENVRNQRVKPTGRKGIREHRKGKWCARIKYNKKEIHLGVFSSPEAAQEAYNAASKKYHKEFAWNRNNTLFTEA